MSTGISFKNKRALVTGAGKGIGRDLVKRLVESGAETFALDKILSDLESLKEECPSIHIVHCDVSDFANLESHIKSCLPIDLLVNNAGVFIFHPLLEIPVESFDKLMNINVKAPFIISQIVAKDMVERKIQGSIINLSSIVSNRAAAYITLYCMSKATLNQMTKNMALELAPHKIRVNAVLPTTTHTNMTKKLLEDPGTSERLLSKIPMGRFAEVEDVNLVIMFLLSDQAAMVTGSEIPVDGGSLCAL